MTLGDRVAILNEGVIQQVAPPMEVYRRPANRFVAGFIGSPAMNFFDGGLRAEDGARWFEAGSLRVPLPREAAEQIAGLASAGTRAILGVRPHDIRLGAPQEGDVTARVDVVEPMGAQVLVHLELGARAGEPGVRVVAPPEQQIGEGDQVGLHMHRDRLHLFSEGGERLD